MMHNLIREYPNGQVKETLKLAKLSTVIDVIRMIDVIRIKNGSKTCFVERVYKGDQLLFFRRTDDFPSDTSAQNFLDKWLEFKIKNEGYAVVSCQADDKTTAILNKFNK